MRKLVLALSGLVFATAAFGSGLSEHTQNMLMDFSYADTDDVGKQTALNIDWLWSFNDGYLQVGAGAGFKEGPDEGESFDSYSFGPLVVMNFLPEKSVTPFISAQVETIGGDAGDFFDFTHAVGVGIRAFIANMASLDVSVRRIRFESAVDFLDDEYVTQLHIGVSFYFDNR